VGLTADEKALLDQLSAKANEPDVDDEFEIEVYDTAKNRGARIPFKHGKKWLFDNLGIGDAPAPGGEGGEGTGAGGAGGEGTGAGGAGGEGGTARGGYFGRK
jgi:hypothetical protein